MVALYSELSVGNKVQASPFALACHWIIDAHPKEFFEAPGLVDVDLSALKLIVKRDSLAVKEIDLFNRLKKSGFVGCLMFQL